MNYRRHYNALINRARTRVLSEYVETHHIIPRCMGGPDEKSNLVDLLPEEHFVAHQLLVKLYPEVPKLVYALARLSAGGSKGNNKLYGWIRRRISKERSIAMKGHTIWVDRKHTDESKLKIKQFNLLYSRSKGRTQTASAKEKIRAAKLSQPKFLCPHCNRLFTRYYADKFHFKSCKLINKINILP